MGVIHPEPKPYENSSSLDINVQDCSRVKGLSYRDTAQGYSRGIPGGATCPPWKNIAYSILGIKYSPELSCMGPSATEVGYSNRLA